MVSTSRVQIQLRRKKSLEIERNKLIKPKRSKLNWYAFHERRKTAEEPKATY
jgi:hypothetical protein